MDSNDLSAARAEFEREFLDTQATVWEPINHKLSDGTTGNTWEQVGGIIRIRIFDGLGRAGTPAVREKAGSAVGVGKYSIRAKHDAPLARGRQIRVVDGETFLIISIPRKYKERTKPFLLSVLAQKELDS